MIYTLSTSAKGTAYNKRSLFFYHLWILLLCLQSQHNFEVSLFKTYPNPYNAYFFHFLKPNISFLRLFYQSISFLELTDWLLEILKRSLSILLICSGYSNESFGNVLRIFKWLTESQSSKNSLRKIHFGVILFFYFFMFPVLSFWKWKERKRKTVQICLVSSSFWTILYVFCKYVAR